MYVMLICMCAYICVYKSVCVYMHRYYCGRCVIIIFPDEYDMFVITQILMNVNNKDIIQMYLGCNWLIIQKTLTNQCFFCEQQANNFKLCSPIKASFVINNLFL